MTERTWHSGPPPSVGWWPASAYKNPWMIRWWNGEWWSHAASPSDHPEKAGFYAAFSTSLENIKWTERWWL